MTYIKRDVLDLILEYLAAQGIIDEVAPTQYRANNCSLNLLDPMAKDGLFLRYAIFILLYIPTDSTLQPRGDSSRPHWPS